MSLQRHKTNSPEARQALGAAMERITVLARVYDRLSHHDTTAVVDTCDFLSSLIDDLRTALAGERPITITTQLERVALTLECALPLGLIINELLTNALKYAFPEAQSGRIEISFVQQADAFVLQVGIMASAWARRLAMVSGSNWCIGSPPSSVARSW